MLCHNDECPCITLVIFIIRTRELDIIKLNYITLKLEVCTSMNEFEIEQYIERILMLQNGLAAAENGEIHIVESLGVEVSEVEPEDDQDEDEGEEQKEMSLNRASDKKVKK